MSANNSIGWGKCSILVKDLDTESAKWTKLPTPKEGSTKLSTSKGDKKEAKIEGGQNEDVKYLKSTSTVEYSLRRNKIRKKPFADKDGVIEHHYAIFIQPENKEVPGPYIMKTTVSVEETFDTEDGGILIYTHDSLIPDDNSAQVKWGTITTDLATIEEGKDVEDKAFVFTNIDAAG
jgi:hypothetical protein